MEIIYKKGIRNGYAKAKGNQIFLIIPFFLKNNEDFLLKMEELWKKLQAKIQKHDEKKQKMQIFSPEGVLLFGERIAYEDLPGFKSEKERNHFFQSELHSYANPLLQSYSQKLGFENIPLRIWKANTKRGSCTHDNRIMLNQHLVHLPTRLICYVIIHETCHLREKNHQKTFRDLVTSFCPNRKNLRKELKNLTFENHSPFEEG